MSRPFRARPASTTVRIPVETHEQLRELAESRNESMQEALAAAVDRLARDQFFEQLNEDFAALRANPELWQQELEERAAWHAIDRWDDE